MNNREPILAVLQSVFADVTNVLEVGSGTGQHAVYFAQHLPHVTWHTGDLPNNHAGISAWLAESSLANLRAPLDLDALAPSWTLPEVDAVFSANTSHIMPWQAVVSMFQHVGRALCANQPFVLYGPFNRNGTFTSASNQSFDAWLRSQFSHQGLRDLEALKEVAADAGFTLEQDISMPSNNACLVWRK